MKYLKIFERYSQPEAVGKLSREVCEFIKKEFEKWAMRKGLANYSNFYKFIPSFKDPDFPVSKVKLKLNFVVTDKYGFNRSGQSHFTNVGDDYKQYKKFVKMDLMTPEIKDNGDTEIGIEIKAYVPKYKKSFSDEKLDDLLIDILMHEIQHSYRSYKLQQKNIQHEDISFSKFILAIRDDIYQFNSDLLKNTSRKFGFFKSINPNIITKKNHKMFDVVNSFFYVAYICSSINETSSFLSQLNAKKGGDWVEDFLMIRNMSFEEIWKSIEPYEFIIYKHCDKNIKNKNEFDAKSLILIIYDIIQDRKEYLFRKIMKIKSTPEYKNIDISKKH